MNQACKITVLFDVYLYNTQTQASLITIICKCTLPWDWKLEETCNGRRLPNFLFFGFAFIFPLHRKIYNRNVSCCDTFGKEWKLSSSWLSASWFSFMATIIFFGGGYVEHCKTWATCVDPSPLTISRPQK